MAEITYKIDGTDISTLGVRVSASRGIVDGLKMKEPLTMDWAEYHGHAVDLTAPRYEARQIELDCWIAADTRLEFITQVNSLLALLDSAGMHRLEIGIDASKSLVYDVYRLAAMDIEKQWSDGETFGTFTITMVEPSPVKKVIKYTRTGDEDKQISVTFTSAYVVHIFWGDGTSSENQAQGTVTHDYQSNGSFLVTIHGVISDITNFSTNGTVVWNQL